MPLAHLGGITIAPLQLIPLLLLAIAYTRRSTRLAARGRPAPLWRQICFGGGLAVIAFALISPLAQVNKELFLAHMSQHLLLGDIAPSLIVLGLTGPILAPILRLPMAAGLRFLSHSLVALLREPGLCGCDLAWIVERSPALVSRHVGALRRAGLLESRREGKMVMHSLSERGAALVAVLGRAEAALA